MLKTPPAQQQNNSFTTLSSRPVNDTQDASLDLSDFARLSLQSSHRIVSELLEVKSCLFRNDHLIFSSLVKHWTVGPRNMHKRALWHRYWSQFEGTTLPENIDVSDYLIDDLSKRYFDRLAARVNVRVASSTTKKIWEIYRKLSEHNKALSMINVFGFQAEVEEQLEGKILEFFEKVVGSYAESSRVAWLPAILRENVENQFRQILLDNDLYSMRLQCTSLSSAVGAALVLLRRRCVAYWHFNLDQEVLNQAQTPELRPMSFDLGEAIFQDLSIPDTDSQGEQEWESATEEVPLPPPHVDSDLCLPGGFEVNAALEEELRPYPGLFEKVNRLKEAISSGVKKATNTHDLFDSVLSGMQSTFAPGGTVDASLRNAVEAIQHGTEGLQKQFEEFSGKVPDFSTLKEALYKYLLPIVALVCGYYRERSELLRVLFYVSIGLLVSHWGPVLLAKAQVLFSPTVRQQSKGDVWIKDFFTIFTPVMGLVRSPSEDLFGKLEDAFYWKSDSTHDLYVVELVLSKVMQIWDAIKRFTGWCAPDFRDYVSGHKDLDDFVKEVLPIVECEYLIPDDHNIQAVEKLYNVVAHLRTKYTKDSSVQRTLDHFFNQLAKIHKEFSRIKTDVQGLRHEPIGLMIYGDPGLGKSLSSGFLTKRLMDFLTADNPAARAAYERAPDRFVYRRRGGQYYEGAYPTNRIVTFPDFGAERANENSSAKHEHEMIQLISNEPYEPEMAFEMKGKLKISPDFVLCTTNNTKVYGQTIVHKGAFARRFIFVKLIWRGEGEKPKPGQQISIDDWRFVISECTEGTAYEFREIQPRVELTFDELTATLCVAHRLSREKHMLAEQFMCSDKFDAIKMCLKVKSIETTPGKKPWEYVVHQAKFSKLFDIRKFEDEVKLDFKPEIGYPDGAYVEKFKTEDGTKLTEDDYHADLPISVELLNAFHQKIRKLDPLSVLDEPWFRYTHGKVEIASIFPVNDRNLRLLQSLFCGDPIMLLQTFLACRPEHKALGDQVLCGLLKAVYRRAGVYIQNPTVEMLEALYERNATLTCYCLVNALDVKAAKNLVAPSMIDVTKTHVSSFLSVLKEQLVDVGYLAMVGITAAIAVTLPVFAMVKVLSSSVTKSQKPKPIQGSSVQQVSAYVDQKNLIKFKKPPPRRTEVKVEKVNHQASEVFLTGQMVVARAQWQIIDAAGDVVSNMLALGGRKFLINDHTYEMIKCALEGLDATQAFLTVKRGQDSFEIPASEFLSGLRVVEKDTYWFLLPSMPECKSLQAHWVPEGFVEQFAVDQMRFFGMASLIPGKGLQTSRCQLIGSRTIENIARAQLWRCNLMNSTRGDCASAAFVASTGPSQGKICGILQSGEEGMGLTYFCAISRYEMEVMCARLDGLELPERSDGKRMVIGHVPVGHEIPTSVRDVLVPSEFPAKEPFKAPVNLKDPEVYNLARKPYCPGFVPSALALQRFRVCVSETLEMWHAKAKTTIKPGTKSYLEAIVGNPGTAFKSIPLNTSPGVPYNLAPTVSKKTLLGHFDNGAFVFGERSQEMFDRTAYYLEQLLRGEVPCDVYTDVVKDELLPKEKVANKKGRLVSACPQARSLVFRILYGNFMEWIMENCNTNGIAAGMNMRGNDAHLMLTRHLAISGKGDFHCSGDLSKNDARQPWQCLEIVMEEINSFLNRHNCMEPNHFRMCETFAKSYHFKFHLRGDLLDLWLGSLDSGDPATSPINSISNSGYARYSIWKGQDFRAGTFHEEYNENVESDFLGDDNWHSVSPAWAKFFDGETMPSGYADFGHVWTDDAKTGSSSVLKPITEIGYLKRSPRYEPFLGSWLMVLDLQTTLEIGLWTVMDGKKGAIDADQALRNVDTMCTELCYHPDEVWDEWLPKFEKMYAEYGWEPKSRNRRLTLERFHGSQALVF